MQAEGGIVHGAIGWQVNGASGEYVDRAIGMHIANSVTGDGAMECTGSGIIGPQDGAITEWDCEESTRGDGTSAGLSRFLSRFVRDLDFFLIAIGSSSSSISLSCLRFQDATKDEVTSSPTSLLYCRHIGAY